MSSSIESMAKNLASAMPAFLLFAGILACLGAGWYSLTKRQPVRHVIPETLFTVMDVEPFSPPVHVGDQRVDYRSVRDPFHSPRLASADAEEELPRLELTMIIIDKRHRMCKVNGKLYREGEQGPDFKIMYIDEEKVLIERRGREQWLVLSRTRKG